MLGRRRQKVVEIETLVVGIVSFGVFCFTVQVDIWVVATITDACSIRVNHHLNPATVVVVDGRHQMLLQIVVERISGQAQR